MRNIYEVYLCDGLVFGFGRYCVWYFGEWCCVCVVWFVVVWCVVVWWWVVVGGVCVGWCCVIVVGLCWGELVGVEWLVVVCIGDGFDGGGWVGVVGCELVVWCWCIVVGYVVVDGWCVVIGVVGVWLGVCEWWCYVWFDW